MRCSGGYSLKNDALVGVIKCTIEGISRTKAVALSESLFYLLLAFQEGIQGGTICFLIKLAIIWYVWGIALVFMRKELLYVWFRSFFQAHEHFMMSWALFGWVLFLSSRRTGGLLAKVYNPGLWKVSVTGFYPGFHIFSHKGFSTIPRHADISGSIISPVSRVIKSLLVSQNGFIIFSSSTSFRRAPINFFCSASDLSGWGLMHLILSAKLLFKLLYSSENTRPAHFNHVLFFYMST